MTALGESFPGPGGTFRFRCGHRMNNANLLKDRTGYRCRICHAKANSKAKLRRKKARTA